MNNAAFSGLKFPCDCMTSGSAPARSEPWARVAKEGMLGGTREKILNLLHKKPQTIAQIASRLRLAQPTVFRHIGNLLESGLVKEFRTESKVYSVEKYYILNFPIISQRDRDSFESDIDRLTGAIARMVETELRALEPRFKTSDMSADGWRYGVFAHYLYHTVQRRVRTQLEKKGVLASDLKKANLDFIFWAND